MRHERFDSRILVSPIWWTEEVSLPCAPRGRRTNGTEGTKGTDGNSGFGSVLSADEATFRDGSIGECGGGGGCNDFGNHHRKLAAVGDGFGTQDRDENAGGGFDNSADGRASAGHEADFGKLDVQRICAVFQNRRGCAFQDERRSAGL